MVLQISALKASKAKGKRQGGRALVLKARSLTSAALVM